MTTVVLPLRGKDAGVFHFTINLVYAENAKTKGAASPAPFSYLLLTLISLMNPTRVY